VFSQAANVDQLLTMLRTLDPAKDNLADNEEIQELYRSCMTLRPKIVKLIDKYSQKRGMLFLCKDESLAEVTIWFPCLQLTWSR
jgi:signal transducing adaptor molecule